MSILEYVEPTPISDDDIAAIFAAQDKEKNND